MQAPPTPKNPDDRRHRAMAARAHDRATKSWDADARAAVAGSIWRLGSAWIEQASGTAFAEFINASSGKSHLVRIDQTVGTVERRSTVQQQLAIE